MQPVELQCRRSSTIRSSSSWAFQWCNYRQKILMWANVMAETLQINELTNRIAYSLVRWFRINLKASFVLSGGGHWWWLQSVSKSGGKWGSFEVVIVVSSDEILMSSKFPAKIKKLNPIIMVDRYQHIHCLFLCHHGSFLSPNHYSILHLGLLSHPLRLEPWRQFLSLRHLQSCWN